METWGPERGRKLEGGKERKEEKEGKVEKWFVGRKKAERKERKRVKEGEKEERKRKSLKERREGIECEEKEKKWKVCVCRQGERSMSVFTRIKL